MGLNIVNDRFIKVRRDTNQTALVTATPTAIIFSNLVFQSPNGTMWSSSTNPSRVTVDTAGYWLFHGEIRWVNAATGNRQSYFRKNGGTEIFGFSTQLVLATGVTVSFSTIAVNMKVGDYMELIGLHDAGANRDVAAVTLDQTPYIYAKMQQRIYDASVGQEVGVI